MGKCDLSRGLHRQAVTMGAAGHELLCLPQESMVPGRAGLGGGWSALRPVHRAMGQLCLHAHSQGQSW